LTIRFVTDILHTETARRRYKTFLYESNSNSNSNPVKLIGTSPLLKGENDDEEEEDDELNNNESSQTQTSFLLLRY
jgi:hypothetical protein